MPPEDVTEKVLGNLSSFALGEASLGAATGPRPEPIRGERAIRNMPEWLRPFGAAAIAPAVATMNLLDVIGTSGARLAQNTQEAMEGGIPDPGQVFVDVANVAPVAGIVPKPSMSLGVLGGSLRRPVGSTRSEVGRSIAPNYRFHTWGTPGDAASVEYKSNIGDDNLSIMFGLSRDHADPARKVSGLSFTVNSEMGADLGRASPNARQLLGSVQNAVIDFVKKHKPHELHFSAAGPRLAQFYDAMAPRLARLLDAEAIRSRYEPGSWTFKWDRPPAGENLLAALGKRDPVGTQELMRANPNINLLVELDEYQAAKEAGNVRELLGGAVPSKLDEILAKEPPPPMIEKEIDGWKAVPYSERTREWQVFSPDAPRGDFVVANTAEEAVQMTRGSPLDIDGYTVQQPTGGAGNRAPYRVRAPGQEEFDTVWAQNANQAVNVFRGRIADDNGWSAREISVEGRWNEPDDVLWEVRGPGNQRYIGWDTDANNILRQAREGSIAGAEVDPTLDLTGWRGSYSHREGDNQVWQISRPDLRNEYVQAPSLSQAIVQAATAEQARGGRWRVVRNIDGATDEPGIYEVTNGNDTRLVRALDHFDAVDEARAGNFHARPALPEGMAVNRLWVDDEHGGALYGITRDNETALVYADDVDEAIENFQAGDILRRTRDVPSLRGWEVLLDEDEVSGFRWEVTNPAGRTRADIYANDPLEAVTRFAEPSRFTARRVGPVEGPQRNNVLWEVTGGDRPGVYLFASQQADEDLVIADALRGYSGGGSLSGGGPLPTNLPEGWNAELIGWNSERNVPTWRITSPGGNPTQVDLDPDLVGEAVRRSQQGPTLPSIDDNIVGGSSSDQLRGSSGQELIDVTDRIMTPEQARQQLASQPGLPQINVDFTQMQDVTNQLMFKGGVTTVPKGGEPVQTRAGTPEDNPPPSAAQTSSWKEAFGRAAYTRFIDNFLGLPDLVAQNAPSMINPAVGALMRQAGVTVPELQGNVVPTGEDVMAGLGAAKSVIQGNPQSVEEARQYGQDVAAEHPIASAAGGVAGDVATLATGRAPVARLLRNRRLAAGKPIEEPWKAIPPGTKQLVNRVVNSGPIKRLARGLGRSTEAGVEGAVLSTLNGGDPVETAALSSGGQLAGSLALTIMPRSAKGLGVFGASVLGATALVRLLQEMIPGGETGNMGAAIDTVMAKVKYGLIFGATAALAGAGRIRKGALADSWPAVAENITQMPRAAVISLWSELSRDRETGDFIEPVLKGMAEQPQKFTPYERDRIQRALRSEKQSVGETITELMQRRPEFQKNIQSILREGTKP